MPNPTCTVNGSPTPADVGAGTTFTIALASTAGAAFWSIHATTTDELNDATTVDATIDVDMGAKTATCTAPAGLGSAVIFTSVVGVDGLGLDADRVRQPSYTTTFKVNVRTAGGLAVIALDETFEQSADFGWISEQNAIIRSAGGGSGSGQTPVAGLVVTADPTPVAALLLSPYAADTRAGAFSFTLPTTPPDGTIADITDLYAAFATHNLKVKSADASCGIQDLTTPTVFQVGTTGTVASMAGAQIRYRYWAATNTWNYA